MHTLDKLVTQVLGISSRAAEMILACNPAKNLWRTNGEAPAPRATASVAWRQIRFVIPGGELRPGVRSPEDWTLRLETHN